MIVRSAALIVMTAVLLGACESLPHDGPSARQVEAGPDVGGYAVVDLDYRASRIVAANPPRVLRAFEAVASQAPVDLIGEGDVLAVDIYEAGAGPRTAVEPQSFRLTVDREGAVTAPFAGHVRVAGLTPRVAGLAIQRALRGKLISPQVVVSVAANLSNAVTVVGEVRNAGRFPLQVNEDRLLDVIASAGGATKPAADVAVTVARGEQSATTTLAALMANSAENIRLAPRDQVRVTHRPRKFSTFGAFMRASQVPIEDETLSLAAAISRIGGLDANAAAADSVLLFRFERPEVADALGLSHPAAQSAVPVVYRLNLREPAGYFVANTFEVRADDLIYAPRSDTAELRKFFELISTISRVGYDISVLSVIR